MFFVRGISRAGSCAHRTPCLCEGVASPLRSPSSSSPATQCTGHLRIYGGYPLNFFSAGDLPGSFKTKNFLGKLQIYGRGGPPITSKKGLNSYLQAIPSAET